MPHAKTSTMTARHGKRRSRKTFPLIALNLAILLMLAGGTVAYGAMSHTVTLTVDGKSSTVRTFGDTVGDVLEAKDVTVHTIDRVSKSPTSSIGDGDEITVSYAKPVTLSVDGKVTERTVYDRTVAQAMDSLDVDAPTGAYVSKKRSAVVPREGMKLVISTPKSLTVVADGKKSRLTTTAPTVDDVLDEAGVKLDSDDEVKPGVTSMVKADQKLRVVRIKKVQKTETVPVRYTVKVQADPETIKGEKTVVQAGKPGRNRERVTLVYADGKLRERIVIVSRSLSEPRPQIVKHGTKAPEESTGDTVWDKIAQCESGGNWSINTGNGYYGGLQFSAATWKSVGGPGLPHQNSREVQIKYAKILQARSGWGQWGCAGARFN
ncbi:MAG: resuscitation-promoting factor [Aeromicrobium sp.]|nr:resuscitation-promoting factor [Aeromicrobium sp.]MCW2823476.1 resuscitation-promoting factor [Aeromicrobium sp.]